MASIVYSLFEQITPKKIQRGVTVPKHTHIKIFHSEISNLQHLYLSIIVSKTAIKIHLLVIVKFDLKSVGMCVSDSHFRPNHSNTCRTYLRNKCFILYHKSVSLNLLEMDLRDALEFY